MRSERGGPRPPWCCQPWNSWDQKGRFIGLSRGGVQINDPSRSGPGQGSWICSSCPFPRPPLLALCRRGVRSPVGSGSVFSRWPLRQHQLALGRGLRGGPATWAHSCSEAVRAFGRASGTGSKPGREGGPTLWGLSLCIGDTGFLSVCLPPCLTSSAHTPPSGPVTGTALRG